MKNEEKRINISELIHSCTGHTYALIIRILHEYLLLGVVLQVPNIGKSWFSTKANCLLKYEKNTRSLNPSQT